MTQWLLGSCLCLSTLCGHGTQKPTQKEPEGILVMPQTKICIPDWLLQIFSPHLWLQAGVPGHSFQPFLWPASPQGWGTRGHEGSAAISHPEQWALALFVLPIWHKHKCPLYPQHFTAVALTGVQFINVQLQFHCSDLGTQTVISHFSPGLWGPHCCCSWWRQRKA